MCKTNQERRTLGRKIVSWLSFGVFVASQSMVLAAPIMPDNNAVITERPLVQETANQIPLVNVTAPTNGGVSMNKYDRFNVEKQGAILNNSYVTSKTELAGYVQGNSNMVNGTAKVIVNQVTSDTPTSMNGYLEVAGQKASVVVANPNGITVNGGGFLNTEHAVLTTGRAELDGAGNLQNYRVEQGKVSIEGKGLDGKRADSVSILARTVDVNAGVWANKLNTRTGQNHIDANNLKATALESSTVETKPMIGLDVAAVGGMYANHITMVGTEAGVGVNLNGVVAGTQSVSVDANGHLSVNGMLQSDTSLVAKANSIQNIKTIASGGNLDLETKELINAGNITSVKNGHIKVEETLTNKNTMAAGANTQGAVTGNGSLSVEAGNIRNTDAVIVSGGTTRINSKEVHNIENGRIYGGKVAIQTEVLENRKNVALESKLDAAMADMKAAEDKLEAAYAIDTTAFTSKTEQDEYLNRIKELSQVYDEKLKIVKLVQEELSAHKGSTVAGRDDVTIEADSILNREKSLVYSGGTMTLDGRDTLHNIGGTIEGIGKGVIRSKDYQNKNSSFTAKRVSPEIEKGLSGASNDAMLTEQEDQILITDKNHSEHGQVFKKSEFTSLNSGYGALHSYGKSPMPIYEAAEYVTVEQITPEEQAAGEELIPAEYIGTQVPSYAYDDPIFKEFGITSMTTERPLTSGPEQEAWDAQYKPILASLNEKIKAHNAKAELHNQKISGVANEKIDNYTIIRNKTMTSKEEVKNSTPGVVRFGGDLSFTGNGTNENSQMVVGGTLTTTGAIDQVAKENQEVTNTFGTTEASYTYKRRWPHKSRRRGYKGQVFMTPQVNKENPISLGVAKKEDKNGKAKGEVGDNHRKEVQDFLNPFAQDSSNDASKPTAGTNILALPTESLYRIHPESTANYVVETDPQFTNKKAFLSSDYMYREMKTKPENIEKRLGDGLYEQTLVRQQIVFGTGYRFLDGYTDDESQFKALMDAGIVYAKQHGIAPGVALTAEQAASLTSDMVWLVKDIVMVEGKPVEVIYPKVYLKQSNGLQLHTDGTLISANTLVMNAKKRIHNEGVIQGKTVVLASNQDIINNGHINADKVGLQSDTTIYQQGQIVGRDAVGLQAKENITFNNSIEHLTNQDVLHKTAGIAISGDTGVMIVSAGNDVNLGGATIEALGKEGAITITAGHDINSTTDILTAKKDMTQDGDNYLRTYRQTELGTTIEAGGNVSIGAKNDIKARNLTVSSDSGAVKVIGENDVSIENGYSESKDAFALKYKEKGLLNKKETKIKTNDESTNALMSTVSGHTVVVGANNDVTLTSSNIVSTAGTSVLAGHDVITDAAAKHTLSTASKDVKKSGIMGAGMGIMIGKKQSKDNYYIDETTHKATTLGSTNGEVTVQAGGTVHLTTTNAVGKNGVVILGQDIILDGKDDLYKQEERHERKSSGLTVSLGGSVVEKIDSAVKKQHSASDRRNSRFKSLEGKQSMDRLLSAIGEAKQIVDRSYNGQMRAINSQLERVNADIVNTPETDATKLAELKAKQEFLLKRRSTLEENKSVVDKATDKAIDRAINVQIGIGSSKSVAESKLERHTYSSGTIDSDGTVLIHANSADSIKGNITAIGEQIKGKNVQLAASNTINLEAGSNTQRVETNSKSSGWNVSANIGMRTGGLVGWSASAYKGTENGIEDTTTHTGTHVVGTNNVSIESGSNTNLIGSTVSGRGVTAKVGNNLTVESLQDSQIYHETSKNKGISISGANFISQPTINGVNVKGNIDSTYKSVTDQSGIHAGNDGVNITVGNTTTLKGAIITSKATPEKNKMSTKSLVMEDIHNEASYKAKKSGIAMNTSGLTAKGILGKINPLGLSPVVSIPVSDEAQSTTKSAISDAILVEVEGKPLTAINRDTEHALNSIKPIFDKADVKERMEYVNAVSDEGFKLIGDIAMKQVQKYEEKVANTSDEALKKRYQKEADKWKDGGIYKVALHGGFGAVVSNMAGGSSLDGFATASANEIMVGAIAKEVAKHPNSTINADGKYVDNSDVYKIASAVLGKTVSHSSLGTGISLSATTSNYLTHEQGKQYEYELSLAKSEKERKLVIQKWKAIDEKQEADYISQEKSIFKKYFNTISDLIDFNIYLPYKRERNRYNISLDRAFSLDSNTGKLKKAMVKVISLPLKEESSFAERIQNEKNIFALNRAEIISKIEGFKAGSDEFDENTLYHYNRIRVGEDKLLSHILKSTDVTRGVLDSFTEDGFSAFERSLGITPSYNQYYYGGKLLGDGIGVVGGGITAGTGVIETGIFTAGGVTAVATPVSVTQIMAGSTLAVHSANNFEKNLTLFAKHNREKPEISTKFNFDEEAPYIRENRLPKDSETILSDGTFDKIGKVEPHGAQVYKKDKKYYYRDTLHFGKKAHLEVFDRKGNHLGEADPLTGEIKPHSADSKKKLSKEYR
ncbi:hemagglutinin repeat-containing protein [Veillonella parvula]|jgi:filamentous hemagglutinin|uniref:two-partner secretion domain-containing protein n=2 Tax=Veillonella TaxID=29465 RepID=UPI00241ED155|nr:hemagglutinin repeat-containing protein [Veillonella parvula]